MQENRQTVRASWLLMAIVGAACGMDPRGEEVWSSSVGIAGDDEGTGETAYDDDAGFDDDEGGDRTKFDLPAHDDLPGGCAEGGCSSCTSVDLLFVIDNSGSMSRYQDALALAFPDFADTLVDALPPNTSVHVGVTSTEMGYSSSGANTIVNNACTFEGDGGQSEDAFYITPDQTHTGRNGAQGRLYDPGGGQHYFAFNTSGDAAQLNALSQWFTAAASIGEGGSNIEMSLAPVGWVADPANQATNAGFIRDAGSVLVLFFVQDEPDQTPQTISGQPAAPLMFDRIRQAKAQCGGAECIIAGGFLDSNPCDRPLGHFLAALPTAPVIAKLPDKSLAKNDPQAAADQMRQHLSNTLAAIIAQTCDKVPPVG